jgi:methylenetetrahydrofolate reductase (NADPH)
VSVEISSRGAQIAQLRALFAPGLRVSITFLPDDTSKALAELAVSVRRAGFEPVPHIAARQLRSLADLDDMLARLTGEAAVERILVLAGDLPRPLGPFRSSMDVLQTGLLQRHAIRTACFAGHPEGHPAVAPEIMRAALREKIAWAETNGIEAGVTTQFCFAAEPIVDWLTDLRGGGFRGDVAIGVAGPASMATLLKFALRCGVGSSIRALRRQPRRLGRLLAESGPDAVVDGLEAAAVAERLGPVALHFFPFGGLASTAAWIERRAPAA